MPALLPVEGGDSKTLSPSRREGIGINNGSRRTSRGRKLYCEGRRLSPFLGDFVEAGSSKFLRAHNNV
jgi:hypothetical protein